MVAIRHALMARPTDFWIDAMSIRQAPLIVKRLAQVVAALAANDIGVRLVEQFIEVVRSLAPGVVVQCRGEVQQQP